MRGIGRLVAAVGLAAALAACQSVTRDHPRFTFPRAESLSYDMGLPYAQAFVAHDLPPGLPMDEAVARVKRAVMACRPPTEDGSVRCRYLTTVGREFGSLGEDVWDLTLTPGPDGRLRSASLTRNHVGLPGLYGH